MARLGDVCVINPKAPLIDDATMVSFVPMPRVGEKGEFDSSEIRPYIEVKKGFTYFADGDVLFAKITPCMENGKGAVAHGMKNGHGCGSTEFHVLRVDRSRLLGKWLYYLTVWPAFRKEAERNMTGSAGQKRVPKSYLENYQINIPTLSEQQLQVQSLNELYTLISLRKQQLAKLDELVKSQFVEMFGTFPANEHGWPVGTIRDGVMDVRYGSSRKAAEGNNGQYPYLRMNNITYGGELDLTDVKTIDIPDDELDKCSVRRGDVLFNRTNSRELVGKTCVYNRDELMVLAGFVVRVRVNDRLLPEFLSAFMNTDFTKTLLLSMCKAAIGQANINATEFQNIGIYFPPIEHQQEFVQIKAQTDKSKLVVQQSIDQLETLKKSLMQKYFG